MKKATLKKSKSATKYPRNASEGLVTEKVLYKVRDEFRSSFLTLNHKLDAQNKLWESHDKKFKSIDDRFVSIDKRFDSVDKRFDSVDRKFEQVMELIKSESQKVLIEIAKVRAESEEQNNRNKILI